MHPIERLRYVARAGSAPDSFLVAEAVPALNAFAHDPNAMLVALKGLISRQPESPGLLCLAAHMIHALEPVAAGWAFADSLEEDQTLDIAETIAITEAGGTDVIDSIASGIDPQFDLDAETDISVLCPAGTTAWIAHAREAGRSVAVVTPLGSRLPALLWERFRNHQERLGDGTSGHSGEHELISLDVFDDVIGPTGLTPLDAWQSDSPDVAEVARF